MPRRANFCSSGFAAWLAASAAGPFGAIPMTSQLELGGLGEPEDGDEPKVVVEKDLDVLAQGWTVYWTRSIKALFFESWFNICMLAAPFAAYYYYTDVDGNNAAMTFGCSLVAIAPFAERLSFVTEQLAMHTSETLGGLLNATFGNVTELVVSLIALNRGLLRIVQARPPPAPPSFAAPPAAIPPADPGARARPSVFRCRCSARSSRTCCSCSAAPSSSAG